MYVIWSLNLSMSWLFLPYHYPSIYSGFGLERFSIYSGFGLDRFSIYSGFGLDRFHCIIRIYWPILQHFFFDSLDHYHIHHQTLINLYVLINVQYTRSLSSVSEIGPLSGISQYNKYILVSLHKKKSMIHKMLDKEQEYLLNNYFFHSFYFSVH